MLALPENFVISCWTLKTLAYFTTIIVIIAMKVYSTETANLSSYCHFRLINIASLCRIASVLKLFRDIWPQTFSSTHNWSTQYWNRHESICSWPNVNETLSVKCLFERGQSVEWFSTKVQDGPQFLNIIINIDIIINVAIIFAQWNWGCPELLV